MSTIQSATRHRVLVVLDHDERVAEVAQARTRVSMSFGVVALVQADRRLVEHVEDADQADCRSASRVGCAGPRRRRASPRLPVKREVVEADVEQEAEPLAGSP
jgi:hypothetical protein